MQRGRYQVACQAEWYVLELHRLEVDVVVSRIVQGLSESRRADAESCLIGQSFGNGFAVEGSGLEKMVFGTAKAASVSPAEERKHVAGGGVGSVAFQCGGGKGCGRH